jgi:RNA polymerase sigma factor (sigma-70 family)
LKSDPDAEFPLMLLKMVAVANFSEWVGAAAAGENAAWNVLYRKFYPGMFAIALRICKDSESATDAVQDGFVTAYLKLSQVNDPENFGGWLRQIVTHTCYRSLSRQKDIVYLESLPIETKAFWEDEINRKFDQLSNQNRLYSAMAHLPEVLHSTLILRYFSTFQSYEEIAAILGVPVGTVRSRLNQARLKLLDQWKRHEDASEADWRESEEWNDYYQAMYGECISMIPVKPSSWHIFSTAGSYLRMAKVTPEGLFGRLWSKKTGRLAVG